MKQKIIIALVAAIIIVGGLFWYMSRHKASAPSVNETNSSSENNFTGEVPGDKPDNSGVPTSTTIAVSTQVPGSTVTIDNVFLDKPGFIVIFETDSKGKTGSVVGVSGLLGAGARQDLEVNATLKPGAKYIAELRADNGDKKFNATTDQPVLNNNIPVMTMFSVSQ